MLVDLRNNSSSGQLALTRIKYREVQCMQIVHKKSYFVYLKKKLKGDTMQVFPIWFNFRSRKKLFKASWLERGDLELVYIPTNIAGEQKQIWRQFGGFEEVLLQCFPFSCVLKDGHRSKTRRRKNIQFSSALGSILLARKVSFYGRAFGMDYAIFWGKL